MLERWRWCLPVPRCVLKWQCCGHAGHASQAACPHTWGAPLRTKLLQPGRGACLVRGLWWVTTSSTAALTMAWGRRDVRHAASMLTVCTLLVQQTDLCSALRVVGVWCFCTTFLWWSVLLHGAARRHGMTVYVMQEVSCAQWNAD